MPDRLSALLDAARRVQESIAPGGAPGVVTLTDAAGNVLFTARVPAPPAAPPSRWVFSPDSFATFDGRTVPVRGQPLYLLELMAAVDHPLTTGQLKAAWHGYEVTDATVRWTIGELRKQLAVLFPHVPEPIASGPDGYRLTIR